MEQILARLPEYINLIAQLLGALVVLATVIVKITPSSSDNIKVKSFSDKFLKVLTYLPTLGVNPRTKSLEAALKEINEGK